MDKNGRTPSPTCTFQFNFHFNLNEDMYASDSIDLLQNSGILFAKHSTEGIDPCDFAEILLGSGLILMDNVYWLSFHSSYDFSYLLHLLIVRNLPDSEMRFHEYLNTYFPKIYDVKYLMKSCKQLKGGLQEIADQLEIIRIGQQHQAGSDSLVTGQVFFKMRELFFENLIDEEKYLNHLYGLGGCYQNGKLVSSDSNGAFDRNTATCTSSPGTNPSN
ncbi:DgyrCDS1750 [Dimorphilus gyrociliatus]|nr:DgyrCDS1750 [Dimorphilus gyrociliatus]